MLTSVPLFAAIAHVQDKANATGSGTSVAVTVTGLTQGNVIVGCQVTTTEGRTHSAAATGVTFTKVVGEINHSGATAVSATLWYGVVDTGGATTVTFSVSGGAVVMYGLVSEFSGMATASFTDQSTSEEEGAAGTSHDLVTGLTTTNADDLLYGCMGWNGLHGGFTAGGSWTEVTPEQVRTGVQRRIVSATGTYDLGDATQPATVNSVQGIMLMAAFKAAGGGGGGAPRGSFLLGDVGR